MALPTSGAISLNAIHIEAGGSSGTLATINDSDIRGLIGKASGVTMSFNEWYGASNSVPFDIRVYGGAGGDISNYQGGYGGYTRLLGSVAGGTVIRMVSGSGGGNPTQPSGRLADRQPGGGAASNAKIAGTLVAVGGGGGGSSYWSVGGAGGAANAGGGNGVDGFGGAGTAGGGSGGSGGAAAVGNRHSGFAGGSKEGGKGSGVGTTNAARGLNADGYHGGLGGDDAPHGDAGGGGGGGGYGGGGGGGTGNSGSGSSGGGGGGYVRTSTNNSAIWTYSSSSGSSGNYNATGLARLYINGTRVVNISGNSSTNYTV